MKFLARLADAAVLCVAVLALSGCAPIAQSPADTAPACIPAGRADLVPASGILSGVNLDWEHERLDQFSENLGHRPAVAVSFVPFPLTATDHANLDGAVAQVRHNGGILLLTLEPHQGLKAVTADTADEFAATLAKYNNAGIPVIVRFAHEMNGSWYEWGQQPAAYKTAFHTIANAIHHKAPGSATMWAPNYGGGYPFTGGHFAAAPGSGDFTALDTNQDGALTMADDSYAPYYPGDDAVDWVGMSLYHWGNTYPWGANVRPEDGKFLQQLTGTYNGAGGNDLDVPDFYTEYGAGRGKPVAIPETAALYATSAAETGANELDLKSAWWKQLFDPAIPQRYPQLKMINWFEWNKTETEVKGTVDWRAAGSPETRQAYVNALPSWFTFAGPTLNCNPAP
ncbi:hypothetical protein QFZ61_000288 [Arthrobacter sp. B3I4]|nr:glycosyl hydrolase [Arthrobacter sp. B3I4]MDQ0754301.1 hypothetical protein [Arthrobacter sp. B3I4]